MPTGPHAYPTTLAQATTVWKFGVYVLTCSVTGMSYVGMFEGSAGKRFSSHIFAAFNDWRDGSPRIKQEIANAIREHGIGTFNWSDAHILCCRTRNDAWDFEKLLIAELQTYWPQGYNKSKGGGGAYGVTLTLESRTKRSVALKKAMARPDVKANQVVASKKMWDGMSPEERKKRTTKSWEGRRRFLAEATAEQRQAMGKYPRTPEARAAQAARLKALRQVPGFDNARRAGHERAARMGRLGGRGGIVRDFKQRDLF